jgi:hypothetical protein
MLRRRAGQERRQLLHRASEAVQPAMRGNRGHEPGVKTRIVVEASNLSAGLEIPQPQTAVEAGRDGMTAVGGQPASVRPLGGPAGNAWSEPRPEESRPRHGDDLVRSPRVRETN